MTTTGPHEVDFQSWARRVAEGQARNYHALLSGDGWTLDGYRVTKGDVTINALSGTISWLDLAPEVGQPRERRWVHLHGAQSTGSIVAIARALAALTDGEGVPARP